MIIYQTDYTGHFTWHPVEKLTLSNKTDVIRALNYAAEANNAKDDYDSHREYHPTKRAAEKYMREYTAEAKEYHAPIEEQ